MNNELFSTLRKYGWLVSLSLLALFLLGLWLGSRKEPETVYVEKPYPVTVEKPYPVHDTIYEYRTVHLPKVEYVHDTVRNTVWTTVHDSVYVQIPIQETEYDETLNDARVQLKISGFQPELENLTVTNLRECPTTHFEAPLRRFGIGIELGYGLTLKNAPEGLISPRPYIGIGIHYNLISF